MAFGQELLGKKYLKKIRPFVNYGGNLETFIFGLAL
jgi:hypothetical protein